MSEQSNIFLKHIWVIAVMAIALFAFFNGRDEYQPVNSGDDQAYKLEDKIVSFEDRIIVRISYIVENSSTFLMIIYNDHSGETTTVILPVRGSEVTKRLYESNKF